MEALGINTCAGTFASGVNSYFDIERCFNSNSIGARTSKELHDIDCIIGAPNGDCPEFVFGLPRTLNEIDALMQFAIGSADVVAFVFDRRFAKRCSWLRDELCMPNNYRIAHITYNTLSFGLPLFKREYMFVAYRNDRPFNIAPPNVDDVLQTPFDVMWDTRNVQCSVATSQTEYTKDQYPPLGGGSVLALSLLPCGWSLNV